MQMYSSSMTKVPSLREIHNPDDVVVRTQTITTNIPSPVITKTITKRVQEVGVQQYGSTGNRENGFMQSGGFNSTTQNFTGGSLSSAMPPGFVPRPTTINTAKTLITQTPTGMIPPDSNRLLISTRNSGRIPPDPSSTFFPHAAQFPTEKFCCIYNCCPHQFCKCIQCNQICIRCCGATCVSQASVGPAVLGCCGFGNCCNSTIPGIGMGVNQFEMRNQLAMGSGYPYGNTGNSCMSCFGGSGNGCFSCCCPRRNQYGMGLAPIPNTMSTPRFQSNMVMAPNMGITTHPPIATGVPLAPPIAQGFNTMTTTSIGTGYNQPMLPINQAGFNMGNQMMGHEMIHANNYQYGGYQRQGFCGNCCNIDWCSNNFGGGQSCCISCPNLQRCCFV